MQKNDSIRNEKLAEGRLKKLQEDYERDTKELKKDLTSLSSDRSSTIEALKSENKDLKH